MRSRRSALRRGPAVGWRRATLSIPRKQSSSRDEAGSGSRGREAYAIEPYGIGPPERL